MTIYEQIQAVLAGREGDIVTATEVKDAVQLAYGTKRASVLPADYCYNRINEGISFKKHLFQYLDRNSYRYVGEQYAYNGLIFQKKNGQDAETVAGEWIDGEAYLQKDGLQRAQVERLYAQYMDVWHYERQVLRCEPTEMRHLMGRIGEFLCVLETDGRLAPTVNEPGFDVVSANNRKMSVKTTAQKAGFIAINEKTAHLFDDLFIVQYKNEAFHVIYNGPKEAILDGCRTYNGVYEVSLSRFQ